MTSEVTFTSTELIARPAPEGLESLVGNTPLLSLRRITAGLSPRVRLLAKAEWFNPGGSVKDRPALNILRTALSEGLLAPAKRLLDSTSGNSEGLFAPGKRLLDSTSGNMGIAYATFAASMGIPVTLTLPANASPERLTILRTLGAELVLTDPLEGSDGAIRIARQMAQDEPERFYYANQYDNPANWQAHFFTTGPELIQQTDGELTHFVAGLGTSGTLMGVSRYLSQYNPGIQIIAAQPDSPFHGLEGLKHLPSSLRPAIFDPSLVDRTMEVSTEAAYAMVKQLAREEGLLVGISSGAAAAAALQVAQELEAGVVVTVFPDAGYKYLSDKSLWGS